MRNTLSIRAAALVVVAVFGFHMSRFYLAADLTNFVCPHHVKTTGMGAQPGHESQGTETGSPHAGHTMPQARQSHGGTHPVEDSSGMRCCCRHTLDGLITTLALFGPTDLANVPLPDSFLRASLTSDLAFAQTDLNPPFIPPRV